MTDDMRRQLAHLRALWAHHWAQANADEDSMVVAALRLVFLVIGVIVALKFL